MLTKAFPDDFQHRMFGLESHTSTIDRALLFENDKIASLRCARMASQRYDIRVHVGSAEFEQDGDSQDITVSKNVWETKTLGSEDIQKSEI